MLASLLAKSTVLNYNKLILLCSFLLCHIATPANATPMPATVSFRIIQTTDLHAHLDQFDYFSRTAKTAQGLTGLVPLIEKARAQQPQHLLIDNGDLIQGSPLGDWAAAEGLNSSEPDMIHPMIAALNALEYDAANLGNHEFNFGLDFLRHTYAAAQFPVLSSNVQVQNEQLDNIQAHTMLTREVVASDGQSHMLKIGLFGVLPPQIMVWDAQHLTGVATVQPIAESAKEQVSALKAAGADLIIAIAHSGLEPPSAAAGQWGPEQAVYQLAQVDGISAILFGHQHRLFPGAEDYHNIPHVDNVRGSIFGIPAVQPGRFGSHLGVIDLTLTTQQGHWQVSDFKVSNWAQTETASDNVLSPIATRVKQPVIEFLATPVGRTTIELSNINARLAPATGVQFIQQAQWWYARLLQQQQLLPSELPLLSAAAPFRAGCVGSNAPTDISAGAVTLGDISDLYAYPNTLSVVQLTGAQLIDWLGHSAQAFSATATPQQNSACPSYVNEAVPNYNFDTLLGLTYQYEISPQGVRVIDIRYQGQPLNPKQLFLVVTNNYRANGGGEFPHLDGSSLIYSSTDEIRTIMANYLRQLPASTYAEELNSFWRVSLD